MSTVSDRGRRSPASGIHPFGRFEDTSVTDMGVHAVRAALADAGRRRGFQAAFCGTAYGGVAAGHKVLGALGLTGMPIVDVEAGLRERRRRAPARGRRDPGRASTTCVLVFGIEKMPKGIIRSSFFEPWREEAGLAATPAYFALRAQRLLRESGLTKDAPRRGGREEPAPRRAQPERDVPQGGHRRRGARVAGRVRAAAPLDAVLAQRRRGRGRAAPGRARDGRRGRARAPAALRSHLPGACSARRRRSRASTTPTSRRPSTLAADDAYEEAGVGPDDVDVVECQDTDAARELLAYEELGLCEPRRAGRAARDGATALGGAAAR